MVAKRELPKGLRSGDPKNSEPLPRKGSVITRVGSYLKRQKQPRFVVKIPKNKPIGKCIYTVQSAYEPVHFNKRKDAEAYKKLLAQSTAELKADIIRREITDEGFEV